MIEIRPLQKFLNKIEIEEKTLEEEISKTAKRYRKLATDVSERLVMLENPNPSIDAINNLPALKIKITSLKFTEIKLKSLLEYKNKLRK